MPEGTYLQGTLVPSPADAIPAGDALAHDFFNVVHAVLNNVAVFRNENELDHAHGIVERFENHYLTTSRRNVITEDDQAPKEDVTQRVAPQPGGAVVPVAGPAIDYNKLAAALVAAQRRAQDGPAELGEGTPE